MEYFIIDDFFPRLSGCAVTLGKFDGFHRGHQKLIKKVLERKEQGEQAVVVTFQSANEMLFTSEEKSQYLESLGVDVLIECSLNEKLRYMKAEDFIKEVLVDCLQVSCVIVGEDFRFGYKRKGSPALLRKYGKTYHFDVEICSREREENRKISSADIREALKKGNMEKVSKLLGRDFSLSGTVEHGNGIGHKKLVPTANVIPQKGKLMPPNGVYVTLFRFEEKEYRSITNVGYKPTIGDTTLGVETFLFDCNEDLYGKDCVVEFKKYVRPEQKFPSIEKLKEQIQQDIAVGMAYFEEKKIK